MSIQGRGRETDSSSVTRDRDMQAIALFLVCCAAFAFAAWSKPGSAPYRGADAVYLESYRECEARWREASSGREPVAMAASWADRYEREVRPAARTGCLDAIEGKPPREG
jgi:hypothetical protein